MSNKIKTFELDSINYIPIVIEDIAGISDLALDYTSSIGGADKPEDGATKNTGALADLDTVDTAQIVDGAVEKVKMALLSVDSDILAANAVTTTKIDDNAITSPKILAGSVIAGKIAANAVTATEINVSTLSAISANIGTITAGTITGVTITGGTVRTSSSGKRVQMTSSDYLEIYDSSGSRRMLLEDDSLNFYNSGTNVGKVFTSSSNFRIYSQYNYVSLEVGSSARVIYMDVGGSTIGYFRSTGLKINSGYDIDAQYAHIDNIVLTNNYPLNENGSMYSNGSNLYVRLGGVWKTVSTY